jgi:succinoglycan biosynthesis transport protein ExoP
MEEREKYLHRSVIEAPASSESEERDVDLRHYLLTIINRIWMILTITVLAVLGATIFSVFQTPLYRSKSVIDLSSPTMYITLPDSASSPLYFRDDSYLNTQYRLLNGKNLANRVREKLNLTETDLEKGIQKSRDKKKSNNGKSEEEVEQSINTQLLKMIHVTPVLETNLCEIAVTSPDPKLSQMLANTWAQEYVEQSLSAAQAYTRKAEELLMEQAKDLQRDIGEKEKLLHEYSLKEKIFKVDSHKSIANEALTGLTTALTTSTQERIDAQIRYQAIRTSRRETIPDVISNPLVTSKKQEMIRLQNEYEEKSKIFKPDYPEMIRLRDQIAGAQKGMDGALQEAYTAAMADAQSKYQQALLKEGTQKKQIEDAKLQSVEMGNKERPYDQILMEIDNKKQLLELLMKKQNSTDVSANVQEKTTTSTRIIEDGDLPKSPYSPDIKKNVFFAFLGGFIGSIVLALMLEYLDRTLKTPEDVEDHLHLPYFGIVPHYMIDTGNGNNGSSKALARQTVTQGVIDKYIPYRLSFTDSASTASEAIKTVRTSLLLSFPGGPPRSILITSSRAGEGKTFTACNLAIALTHLDKRVVIVDGDMRNPHIHRVWEQENKIGLSVYLASDAPLAAVVNPSPLDNLFTITSGPKTPRPAELLASSRFQELIRELENSFDFVIVDSPPILPVTDSVIIASRVNGVLLVVRGGATPRDLVKMAKKKLSASNGVIAGVVLNGIDLTDPYYYYRYYSDYYSSYHGERAPGPDPRAE